MVVWGIIRVLGNQCSRLLFLWCPGCPIYCRPTVGESLFSPKDSSTFWSTLDPLPLLFYLLPSLTCSQVRYPSGPLPLSRYTSQISFVHKQPLLVRSCLHPFWSSPPRTSWRKSLVTLPECPKSSFTVRLDT